MSIPHGSEWQSELGIVPEGSKNFFASKSDLVAGAAASLQSHILRRAFDLLRLDGILCTEHVPLVYFKLLRRVDPAEIVQLHRKFWNHGGAPILALVTPKHVHVYSGFIKPESDIGTDGQIAGLVSVIERASESLREFLPAVESGEFFRLHEKSFDPSKRVDRDLLDNLQATREKLIEDSTAGALESKVLDALLCRLVFACYLFDRGVVGQAYLRDLGHPEATHLRDVLSLQPRSRAKKALYDLFRQLGKDFNGDLFSDNLDSEASTVSLSHVSTLAEFFHGTNVRSGQRAFWPYDFAAIPIEAISAIYERFLTDKSEGAFYTPRFLVELVLDIALGKAPSLLGKRYFDPACGSGIFLVGVFNRMAEEWRRANPDARNDRRARELRRLLSDNLFGVDKNPTACRITAFSLYLAYLDQLSPRDIQELKEKGHRLPTLVHYADRPKVTQVEGEIWCGDFFDPAIPYLTDADMVIGNPPWGSTAVKNTPAAKWCSDPDHLYPIPDNQIAAAFIGKATYHVKDNGNVCFVLPHGTLFNQSKTALAFQRTFLTKHAVNYVLNLADYQRFLFEEAEHPALVVGYQRTPPSDFRHIINYWTPKTNWLVTKAEIISIMPEDRSTLTVGEVLQDLAGPDAPQIWKQRFWATPRDWRLLDRISLYSRLRDHVRQTREDSNKRWLIAEGWQPMGENDNPDIARPLHAPSKLFVDANSPQLDLFLLPRDCIELVSKDFMVRRASNSQIFRAPHVLVAQGFTSVAFADFDVSFRHAIRGISGPHKDRAMLVFLTAYLRSSVAKYFLFHTSSNWGVSRQRVGVEELLRLPFPMPEELPSPERAAAIIAEVDNIVSTTARSATEQLADREELVQRASISLQELIEEYFDITPDEKSLLQDTERVIIPSVRPTRKRPIVPTINPSKPEQRTAYVQRLCQTLNGWAKEGRFTVHGTAAGSPKLGIGVAVLQKSGRSQPVEAPEAELSDLLRPLERLTSASTHRLNAFELIRGAKVFHRDRLYIVKPIGRRFWTETAALNDADEIAGTILTHRSERPAWR